MDSHLFGYLDCIRVEEIVSVEGGGDFNVANEGLRESCNVSIFHEYHETIVDTTQYTIKEAISNNNYRENECWINALMETYQGTYLTQEKRGSLAKTLSRDKILELLDVSDEEFIKNGASVMQMDRVFKYFNIPVRLYNFNGEILYKHDPLKLPFKKESLYIHWHG